MKKNILLLLIIVVSIGFMGCGKSDSFQFKVTDVQVTSKEGLFVSGKVVKGTLREGEKVTIESNSDGTTKKAKVQVIINSKMNREVGSISKGDRARIGLGDVDKDDVAAKDMLVK
ncbi:GTPBP1 family GTP-binding protein [Clostridium felsineum]|uniref:hypothetical protein n=1 Tax=Clostridium felsineum TaxID=36839 RepID=UPI00098CBE79|nr:hypothetical protein [Clostridium felsineum]URZ04324.1 hypothetical protein CLAUR_044130 [Clostridium felsineum]